MGLTDMNISEHVFRCPDTHMPHIKIRVNIIKLDKQASEKILAKVEQQSKDGEDKHGELSQKEIHLRIQKAVNASATPNENNLLGVDQAVRRKYLHKIVYMHNIKKLEDCHKVIKAEEIAYVNSASRA